MCDKNSYRMKRDGWKKVFVASRKKEIGICVELKNMFGTLYLSTHSHSTIEEAMNRGCGFKTWYQSSLLATVRSLTIYFSNSVHVLNILSFAIMVVPLRRPSHRYLP